MATKLTNSIGVESGDIGVFALPYGECSTAAATAAKTVTVQGDFVLETGAMVAVKFTYTNSAASPTLNVTPKGGTATGAKTIAQYGTTAASTSVLTSWTAGQVVIFVYDGTYWQRTFRDTDTNTHYTSKNIVGASNSATANAAATNGNVYLNHLEESAVKSSHNIKGTGTVTVTSDANGVITINGSSHTGDITGVTAGNGLTGGGSSGSVTLNVGGGDGISVAADSISVSFGSSATEVANTSGTGSASTVSRSDHVHALPARLRSNQTSTGALSDPNQGTQTGFYYVTPATAYSAATTDAERFRLNPFRFTIGTANTDYRLLVTEYSDKWIQQLATDFRSDNMYLRRCENGTWTTWVKFSIAGRATSGNSGTAGTVAPNGHTHSVTAAGTTGNNTAGDTVSKPAHTHALGELKFAGTAAGHTHTWSDTSDGPSKTTTVPSTSHTHSIPEHTTGGPSGTTSVGSSTHTHSIPELKFTGTSFDHTHSIPAHTTGANSGTAFSAAPDGHTHSVSGTSGAASTSTGHTYDAAAKTHNHSFTGTAVTSGANSGTAGSVAPSGHTHSVTPTASVSISSQRYVVTFPPVASGTNSGTAFSAAPSGHTHSVTASGTIGNNTSGATVSTASHTHSVSIASGANSGTAGSVAPSGHTHTTSAKTTGSTTHTPEGSITVGTGDSIGNTGTPSATSSVASSGHTHTASAKTSGAVSTSTSGHTVSVASSDHTHAVSGTTGSTSITPAGTISKGTGTSIGSTGSASTSSGHTYDAAAKTHNHSFSGTAVTSGTNSGTGFSAAPSGHTHTTN